MKIELELHEDYFKALNELLEKVNNRYGDNITIDGLVSRLIRKHVIDDLEEFDL